MPDQNEKENIMPTTKTKTKPAARSAEPIQPEPPQPTAGELRRAETKRQFQALHDFAEIIRDVDECDFGSLKTFKLIMDRNRGCNTPIEEFITNLVMMYGLRDDDGKGLTLEDIQFDMRQFIIDDGAMERAIRDAHYMASRYPLPEPEKADTASSNQ
jgi:hypothetical protein